MKKHDHELLSISATARRLKRSRRTIHNWIANGLKTHAGKIRLAEAEAFASCRRRGPESPHLRKLARESTATTDPAVASVRAELDGILASLESGEGAAATLARVRHVERVTFGLLASAQRAGDPAAEQLRARLHIDAASAMLKVENLIDQRRELEGVIRSEYENALVAWSEPLKSHLASMPRSLAPRCNPLAAGDAETVLREWVNTIFYPLLNAKPPTPKAP